MAFMSVLPRPPKKILFPNEVILQTSHFTVAQDWEVPIRAFYVIGSVQARRSITDFEDRETIELIRLQRLVRECMRTLLGILDVYFFQNEDSEHGFHIWIFPRYPWMESVAGKKIESVRPIIDHAVQHVNERVLEEIYRTNELVRKYLAHIPVDDYLRQDLLTKEAEDMRARSEHRELGSYT